MSPHRRGKELTCIYTDVRSSLLRGYRTMTLPTDEFVRRFLLHVLPRGFHRIRHYGLLASGNRRDNLARARELRAVPPTPPTSEPDERPEPANHRPPCPCWGGRMLILDLRALRPNQRMPCALTWAVLVVTRHGADGPEIVAPVRSKLKCGNSARNRVLIGLGEPALEYLPLSKCSQSLYQAVADSYSVAQS